MIRLSMLPLLAVTLCVFTATGRGQDKKDSIKIEKAIEKIKELGGTFEIDDKATIKVKPLVKVVLAGTPAKNADLEVFKGLYTIEELRLSGTKITNSGLGHLKGLTNLRTLDLRGCGINDDSMVHLKNMTKLQSLNLSDTEITDAGLENLKKMTLLITLNIRKTKVTEKGEEKLKKYLPEVNIVR